ncbi:hypothetical protein E2C01_042700 [Portunus trituberculatus]|uniref:Uncharacterized protein n=1 Tax=Portunus trituberculatus TaxID=210409 RepID=A0A5B7FX82_PORTR|nr:hypothetical protein [Portunus trituberculatus]
MDAPYVYPTRKDQVFLPRQETNQSVKTLVTVKAIRSFERLYSEVKQHTTLTYFSIKPSHLLGISRTNTERCYSDHSSLEVKYDRTQR